MITIYTDGAARGNPGPGGWGVIIFDNNWIKELGGREDHTTNNRMELTAAIKALEETKGEGTIYTDSEYVMKGITEWIKNWQLKGWRTAGKKKVLNQDLWQKLLEVSEGRELNWKYVAGHSGEYLNDRADTIATSFADNLPPDLYDGPEDEYK
jgi:ribonuclease HI